PERRFRVGRIDRCFLAFEELPEGFRYSGAQKPVSITEVMIELWRSDIGNRADRSRRKLRFAFFLKSLQGCGQQGVACVHGRHKELLYGPDYTRVIGVSR